MSRGGAAVGWLRFWIAKTRRPADAGQNSFTWPRTRGAASHDPVFGRLERSCQLPPGPGMTRLAFVTLFRSCYLLLAKFNAPNQDGGGQIVEASQILGPRGFRGRSCSRWPQPRSTRIALKLSSSTQRRISRTAAIGLPCSKPFDLRQDRNTSPCFRGVRQRNSMRDAVVTKDKRQAQTAGPVASVNHPRNVRVASSGRRFGV
jgi:hypothetical protein